MFALCTLIGTVATARAGRPIAHARGLYLRLALPGVLLGWLLSLTVWAALAALLGMPLAANLGALGSGVAACAVVCAVGYPLEAHRLRRLRAAIGEALAEALERLPDLAPSGPILAALEAVLRVRAVPKRGAAPSSAPATELPATLERCARALLEQVTQCQAAGDAPLDADTATRLERQTLALDEAAAAAELAEPATPPDQLELLAEQLERTFSALQLEATPRGSGSSA